MTGFQSVLYGKDRMFRTDLGAYGTSRAHIRIDPDPFLFNVKSGASQVVDAVAVIFAFFTDIKDLARKDGVEDMAMVGNSNKTFSLQRTDLLPVTDAI